MDDTALGPPPDATLVKLLAELLETRAVRRDGLASVVEYLDYVNHARYAVDELERALAALVLRGDARETPEGWAAVEGRAAPPQPKKKRRSRAKPKA